MPIPTLLEKYTGKVSKIGYFEYNKGTKNTGNLRHWQRLFQTGEAADDAPDYIKKAAEAMKYENLEPEERDMADNAEKIRATWEDTLAYAIAEGKAEGEAKGKAEGKAELVRNMFEEGTEPALIAKLTRLPKSTVLQILQDVKQDD
jgi:flagellar biosynthesis/type III secretory pathway protein FliH